MENCCSKVVRCLAWFKVLPKANVLRLPLAEGEIYGEIYWETNKGR